MSQQFARQTPFGLSEHQISSTEPPEPTDGLLWTNPDEDLPGLDHEHILPSVLYFTSNDTFVKADYQGLRAVRVKCQGGGGAGGGAEATSSNAATGSGGSGGGYAESLISVEDLDATEAITVGAGGAGSAGANGGDGGDSVFDTIPGEVRGIGGFGGTTTGAGTGGSISAGPSGGGGTGDLVIPGGHGGQRQRSSASDIQSGPGGSSHLGNPGPFRLANNNPSSSMGGLAGQGYGAGGSGAGNTGNQSAQPGGNGAPGIVIVELIF